MTVSYRKTKRESVRTLYVDVCTQVGVPVLWIHTCLRRWRMSLLTVTLSHFPDTFTPAPQEHRAPLFPAIFRSHACITTPFLLKFYYDDSHHSALSQHIISSVFLFRLIIISPASPLILKLNMGQPDNV